MSLEGYFTGLCHCTAASIFGHLYWNKLFCFFGEKIFLSRASVILIHCRSFTIVARTSFSTLELPKKTHTSLFMEIPAVTLLGLKTHFLLTLSLAKRMVKLYAFSFSVHYSEGCRSCTFLFIPDIVARPRICLFGTSDLMVSQSHLSMTLYWEMMMLPCQGTCCQVLHQEDSAIKAVYRLAKSKSGITLFFFFFFFFSLIQLALQLVTDADCMVAKLQDLNIQKIPAIRL